MSTVATDLPISARSAPRRSLIAAAAVFAVTALFDLIARPYTGNGHFHAASAYVLSALLIPFALTMLWALADLRSSARVDSRLATIGLRVAGIGLILFLPCAIASLATTDPQALGPLYMIAMLLSLVGTALLSYALGRAGALAPWMAIALPVAWLVGGPVGEGGAPIGFRGAALILAAVCLAIARTAPRRSTT